MVGRSSPVWLFFRKCDDSNAASCIVRNKNNDECGAKISRSHCSTSQLFKHLKSCHRAQYNEVHKLRSKDEVPANQKQLPFRSDSGSGTGIESPGMCYAIRVS